MARTTAIAAGLAAALAAALAVTIKIEETRLAAARERAAAAALGRLNVEAERDSTRDVARTKANVAELLGDSLRVMEKPVVQTAQRADALARALGTERRASYALTLSPDPLRRSARASGVLDSAGVIRRAAFDVTQTPFRVQAAVEVPPSPDSATIALAVSMEPVRIEARLSCGASDQYGARAALVGVVAPRWAKLRTGEVSQTPEVCAPGAAMGERKPPLVSFERLVLGLGLVRGPREWRLGGFGGIGVTICR